MLWAATVWAAQAAQSSHSLLDTLSSFATIVLAVGVVIGGILAALKRGWGIGEFFRTLRTDVAGLKTDVADIHVELHPNGGSSLADSVRRQEIVNNEIAKTVEVFAITQKDQGKLLEDHSEAIAALQDCQKCDNYAPAS